MSLFARHVQLLCIVADFAARSKMGNISLLHDQLLSSLHHANKYSKSGKLKLSMNARLYMHQLYCLEDVFTAT